MQNSQFNSSINLWEIPFSIESEFKEAVSPNQTMHLHNENRTSDEVEKQLLELLQMASDNNNSNGEVGLWQIVFKCIE